MMRWKCKISVHGGTSKNFSLPAANVRKILRGVLIHYVIL